MKKPKGGDTLMLTEDRWQMERKLMQNNFPQFVPFAEPPWFGFQGYLIGRKTGRRYEVVIEGDERKYPHFKPAVYLNPQIGRHWINPEHYGWSGRPQRLQLCLDSLDWKPARSSFANMLLRVIKYVEEFDA
jgi:hypothetical protein